jgi:starvation-inducible DNA-binding protein
MNERARLTGMGLQSGVEVQAFGEVRTLPIALSVATCSENAELLNGILADSIVLHGLYKKHHWLMRGHTIDQLHLLLDRHAAEQAELIDMVAERVQTLGAIAVADVRHVAEITEIERPPNGTESVPAMLARLLEAHEMVIARARTAIDRTALNTDWGTNDLLVGGVLRTNEKQVWIIAEHLVDREHGGSSGN